jgi:16S rRNA (guanine527-N7)-methyltransferase
VSALPATPVDAELTAHGIVLGSAARERLLAYAALLLHWNRRINLVGARSAEDLWRRHLLDCLMLETVPRDPALRRWVDAGSGGGLPAIVFAIVHPDLHVSAAESVAKKATFLAEAARQLGLSNLLCLHGDAYRLPATPAFVPFDALLARAFAPLGELLALGLRLVRPGGQLWAMKGRRWEAEAAAIPAELRAAFGDPPAVHAYRLGPRAEGVILVYRRPEALQPPPPTGA